MRGSSNFCQGGGVVQARRPEISLDKFFFYHSSAYCTDYRGGQMVLLQRKVYFPKDPEGVQHFPGGPTFPGGGGEESKCIYLEKPI